MGDDHSKDESYYEETRALLEDAYLSGGDLRAGSEFRGNEVRCERTRRPIMEAIHHDGSFLDVRCANGFLMESIAWWAAEEGFRIEPYGPGFIPSLAELTRKRIHTGNVMEWTPPRRFDFVRTELEYAPENRRKEITERLLRYFAAPGGRAIICSYGSSRRLASKAASVADILRGWNYEVAGEAEAADTNGVVTMRIAWITAT